MIRYKIEYIAQCSRCWSKYTLIFENEAFADIMPKFPEDNLPPGWTEERGRLLIFCEKCSLENEKILKEESNLKHLKPGADSCVTKKPIT